MIHQFGRLNEPMTPVRTPPAPSFQEGDPFKPPLEKRRWREAPEEFGRTPVRTPPAPSFQEGDLYVWICRMAYLNRRENKEFRRSLRKAATDAESVLWRHLRNCEMHGYKFYRQFGAGIFILDFYCPEKKLAIEIDGSQHGTAAGRIHDVARSEYLASHGINVARYWNNEVLNELESVLNSIADHLASS